MSTSESASASVSSSESSSFSSISSSMTSSLPDPYRPLSQWHSAFLIQFANDWLTDRDAAGLAATEKRMLIIMQEYKIKQAINVKVAWKWMESLEQADADVVTVTVTHTSMMCAASSQTGATATTSLSPTDAAARNSSDTIVASAPSSSLLLLSSSSSSTPNQSIRVRPQTTRSRARIGRVVAIHARIDTLDIRRDYGDGMEAYSALVERLSSSSLPRSVREVYIDGEMGLGSISTEVLRVLISIRLPDWVEVLDMSDWYLTDECRNNPPYLQWILPRQLTTMELPLRGQCHGSINQLTFPSSLTDLHLGAWQGNADQLSALPSNLQTLHLGQFFDAPLDPVEWPQSLQSLTLSWLFDHPLECVRLPNSLTHLHLGRSYNHPIESMPLPASLTELDMGALRKFNHPLEQLRLPCALRILRLPPSFNHPLDRLHLPASMTELELGEEFNQPLVAWNPPASLTSLQLPTKWTLGASQLRIPPNLPQLTLSLLFNEARESLSLLRLPPTLHTLRLGGAMEGNDLAALTFPASLTSLDLGDRCHASLDHVVWPPHLTRLMADSAFDQPLLNWSPPPSLTELELADKYGCGWWNLPVSQLRLPPNLRKLTFGEDFNQPLTGLQFPPSLRVLRFGQFFNQSLAHSVWTPPADLEELDMGRCQEWNRPCTDLCLPARLRKLILSKTFNQPLENEQGECELQLPETLTELRFGFAFNQSLRSLHLPSSLRYLSIPSYFANYRLDQLPSTLPSRLQCLKVYDENRFRSSWFQHPTWPKHCAVMFSSD